MNTATLLIQRVEIKEHTKVPSRAHIREGIINKNWIILDNVSTINIFSNDSLLTNIHPVDTLMTIYYQSGAPITNPIGTLP